MKANCFCSTINPRGSSPSGADVVSSSGADVVPSFSAPGATVVPPSSPGADVVPFLSGIQSDHRIHLILPARAVSYMIK